MLSEQEVMARFSAKIGRIHAGGYWKDEGAHLSRGEWLTLALSLGRDDPGLLGCRASQAWARLDDAHKAVVRRFNPEFAHNFGGPLPA